MVSFKKRIKEYNATGFFPGRGTFAHGVHPPEQKALAADSPIEIMPTPKKVVLPLLQHIGGPCTPLVKAKQTVVFGEKIGKGEAFISASLHAPVSGIVQKTETVTLANGRHLQALAIKTDGDQLEGQALWDQMFGGKWPQKSYQAWHRKISPRPFMRRASWAWAVRPFPPMSSSPQMTRSRFTPW